MLLHGGTAHILCWSVLMTIVLYVALFISLLFAYYLQIFDDICLNVPIYTRFSIERAEWEAAQIIIDILKVQVQSQFVCRHTINLQFIQAFRDASTMISGSQYPTLSLSLYYYLSLLATLDAAHKSAIVEDFPNLQAGIDAAKTKLIKFFDKSTAESEYYYFATGVCIFFPEHIRDLIRCIPSS
jgi:hypothetical protein